MTKETAMEMREWSFDNNTTRFFMDEKGEMWTVAKDVCMALDYPSSSSVTNLVAKVPDQWKGTKRISTLGGEQELLCLSEQGLYFFLGRSDKPKALPYQMRVAGEIMPSIRKHGFYGTEATIDNFLADPDNFIKMMSEYKEERTKRLEAEAKASRLLIANEEQVKEIKNLAPKAKYCDEVLEAAGLMTITEIAKDLGIRSGHALNKFLLEKSVIFKQGSGKGSVYLPTAKYTQKGYFDYHTVTIQTKDGNKSKNHLKATQVGRKFITELWQSQFQKHPTIINENRAV